MIDCPLENKHIFDFLPTDYWVIIPPVDAAKGEFENDIVRIIEMKMVYLELLKLMLSEVMKNICRVIEITDENDICRVVEINVILIIK